MGNFRKLCALGLVSLWGCGEDTNFPTHPGIDSGPLLDSGPGNDALADARPDGGLGPDAFVDGEPPVIELISPDPGTLLRGVVNVEVAVTDASAITKVTASIAGNASITMTKVANSTHFVGGLDTTPLTGLVAPPIVVRARDAGGLESELGFVITLDNEGPFASLDPPNARTFRDVSGVTQCSQDFDPVGSDAPNDGETVAQLIELRGRVTDVGNTGTLNSTLFIPTAGIKSVQLYVFDDSTKPLVVDTDGDTFCDDVNPDIVPATVPVFANEAAVVELQGIAPTGKAFFAGDTFGGSNSTCSPGTDTVPPPAMCLGETATVAIQTDTAAPQIFGIPPVNDFNCLGFAFDARASNISDGFACVALLVTDNLGNRRVSEPLRICIDSNVDGSNGCGAMGSIAAAGNRPNCTGTVTAGVVNNTACTPKKYFSGVANEFELIRE